MDFARAGADFRRERSAWQVSQIVAFGIFSSYVEFAYLIAGDMNAAIFLFWQNLFRLKCAVFYNPKSTFSVFVKILFFVFFRTLSAKSLVFGFPMAALGCSWLLLTGSGCPRPKNAILT